MSEDYQVAKSRKMIKLNNSGSFEQRKWLYSNLIICYFCSIVYINFKVIMKEGEMTETELF